MRQTKGLTPVNRAATPLSVSVYRCTGRRRRREVAAEPGVDAHRLLIGLLIVAALCGCDGTLSERADSVSTIAKPTPVNVIRLVPSERVTEEVIYFGRVLPARRSSLAFGVAGRVASVAKARGDRVEANELIASLDQALLEEKLNGAALNTASLREEAAELRTLVRSLDNQQRLAEVQQRIASSDSEARTIERQLEAGRIVAPYAGYLAEVQLERGDSVAAGRPVCQVHGSGPLRIELHVSAEFARGVQLDQEAWRRLPNAWSALRVTSIAPHIDPASQTCSIELRPRDPSASVDWRAGENAEIRFLNAVDVSGYWLPKTSLAGEWGGAWRVYSLVRVGESWQVEESPVEILRRVDDRLLCTGDLTIDQLVLADGVHRVVPGQVVKPVRTIEGDPPSTVGPSGEIAERALGQGP